MNFELYKEFLCYCVMQGIEDPHAVEKALEIARAAENIAGHKLDIEAYTYLIQVCGLNRKTELAEQLWKEMDEKQVAKDNQQIYGAIMRMYALADEQQKAQEIYKELVAKDLVPTYVTFERLWKNLKYL